MNTTALKQNLARNLSNLPGWRTRRRIVVIESDDWGSIRMSSPEAFERLHKAGIPVDRSHYNRFDGLESNDDLSLLMDTLSAFRDASGRPPVITGVNVVANPDFERIRAEDFRQYYYEPYTRTLERYPAHDRVAELWREATQRRLLVPVFHGREHLNASRWMRALQSGNRSTLLAFDCGVTGIPRRGIGGEEVPNFQAAFDLDTLGELEDQHEVLRTGLGLFGELHGYRAACFVPTNGYFHSDLEKTLAEEGVRYVNTSKVHDEPLGEGRYRHRYRYLGMRNREGQTYLTRNCFFEPASMEHPAAKDWVGDCLREIEIAFRWHKPATVSSHRANYIGWLDPANRERSLARLRELLGGILRRWPDAEFLTSTELGDLIARHTDGYSGATTP